MAKNIAILVLVVLCVVLGTYSMIQRTEANRMTKLAIENETLARSQSEIAAQQRTLAEASAKEAHRQKIIAEQNLLECIQRKKSKRK